MRGDNGVIQRPMSPRYRTPRSYHPSSFSRFSLACLYATTFSTSLCHAPHLQARCPCSDSLPENTQSLWAHPLPDPCLSRAFPVLPLPSSPAPQGPSALTPHLPSCRHSWWLTECAAAGATCVGPAARSYPDAGARRGAGPSVSVCSSETHAHNTHNRILTHSRSHTRAPSPGNLVLQSS